jgi:hypothetical protein
VDSAGSALNIFREVLSDTVSIFTSFEVGSPGIGIWGPSAIHAYPTSIFERRLRSLSNGYALDLLQTAGTELETGAGEMIRRYRPNFARSVCEHLLSNPLLKTTSTFVQL